MKSLTRCLILALSLTFSLESDAAEVFEFYNGVRSLGMGGAYVTTVNDETALYTNPAALGKLRDAFITVADPELQFSSKIASFVKLDTVDNLFSGQGMLDLVKGKPGDHLNFKFQLSPGIVTTNFGLGVLAKWESNFQTNAAGDTVSINYRNDYAAALGYNLRLFDGIVKLGFTGMLVNRTEAIKDVASTTTDLKYESIASEGMGAKLHAGLLVTAPVSMLPTLGIVVRDVGNTRYTLSDGMFYETTTRPQSDPQKVDVGTSISPIFSNRVRGVFSVEVHDALGGDPAEKSDVMRRFHGGLELNFGDIFFVRGGWNQKYWTAGFEFASQRFQLQTAFYGEEIGTEAQPKEDRRLVTKLAIRF